MIVKISKEQWFTDEFERLRKQFEQGDYSAFMEALLLCCWNDHALPQWISTLVIQQAEDAFAKASTGPGKLGNWRAKLGALQIHKQRADLAEHHLRARRRQGRSYVSDLAVACGYGTPTKGGGANVATRADVFEFVSRTLKGTLAQGTPDRIERSYRKMRSTGRRMRGLE